jgi:PAS domain S-box-containing protein
MLSATPKKKPNPRRGLILLVALALMALAAMGGLEYRAAMSLKQRMIDETTAHVASQARILSDSIEGTMQILERITDEAKTEALRKQSPDSLGQSFRRIALFAPDIERVGFFDPSGKLSGFYSRTLALREDCSRCEFFIQHIELGDGFGIGPASDATTDGRFRLGLSQKIVTEAGKFGGVVISLLSPEQMEQRFSEYISPIIGRIVLFDRRGNQIVRWPQSQLDNVMVEHLTREIRSSDNVGTYVHPEYSVVLHNLRQFPLTVAIFINVEQIDEDWFAKWRERAVQFLGFASILLVLSLVAWLQLVARYKSELELLLARDELEARIEARTEVLRREISHRAKMERELFESEERFHQFMNNTPVLACIIDGSGRVVFANRGFIELCGHVDDELAASTNPVLASLMSGVEHGLLPHGRALSREVSLQREGRELTYITYDFPVEPASGVKYRGFAALDVTEHREAERHLAHAQKMEALGQLTGGVAHDFNNLLTIILGNLEMMIDTPGLDADIAQLSEEAIQAARLGANLTDRLLAISRKRRYKPEIIEVNSAILSLSHLLRRSLGAMVEVRLKICSESINILIDPVSLENAIINLCLNSRDAMPSGGVVTISTEFSADGRAAIIVEDNGSGMPREVLERAIDPFFTTKAVGKGTGLGLSMVHGLVVQAGGELKIDSTPGKGTRIAMFLPTQIEATGQRLDLPSDELPRGDETILVVEDNAEVRRFAVTCLRSLGYKTLEASSGRIALEMLAETGRCDLVFSDVIMPGMDGYELAMHVRQTRPNIKILLASGHVGEKTAVREDITLLAKPYGKPALAKAIRAQFGVIPNLTDMYPCDRDYFAL